MGLLHVVVLGLVQWMHGPTWDAQIWSSALESLLISRRKE